MDKENMFAIKKCLDRYEGILRKNGNISELNSFCKDRFDHFIDMEVSKINARMLAESDDETLVHDMSGIFNNIERNPSKPEDSKLGMFVPRVGFIA